MSLYKRDLEKFKHLKSYDKLTIKEHLEITIRRGKPMLFCGKHGHYLESGRGCRMRNCSWFVLEKTVKVYV